MSSAVFSILVNGRSPRRTSMNPTTPRTTSKAIPTLALDNRRSASGRPLIWMTYGRSPCPCDRLDEVLSQPAPFT